MLPTFVIGLREGLEAALIVGIIAAITLCAGVAVALHVAERNLPQRQQEGLETVVGLVAVAMVTWMIVWIRRNACGLKADLEGRAATALVAGSVATLVAMAFLAVLREGLETAVFLLAAFQSATDPSAAGGGAVLGIVAAVTIGYGIYRGGVRINLDRFLRLTGLVLVAAGLLATAAHTAHEAGWLIAAQGQVANLGTLVDPGSVRSALLTGMLGVQPRPVTAEAIVWLAYAVPMTAFVLWPSRRQVRRPAATTALATIVAMLAIGGCGSSTSATRSTSKGTATRQVKITLTEKGCEPAKLSLAAGPTTFVVRNDDADAVTEFEVVDGDRILGEVELVAPGLEKSFSMTLKPGKFAIACPGGTEHNGMGSLVVAGATSTTTGGADDTARTKAIETYRAYLEAQAGDLVAKTQGFVTAVRAGDVDRAKSLYAPARVPYERIEPVAERFGDLDPRIDAREGDVPAEEWGGFHRIEKALWVDNTTAGMAPVADALLGDTQKLAEVVKTVELEPATIANGAVELLNEVTSSKVTGEEERYSRTDLVDLEANVEGSRAAFDAVAPLLLPSRSAVSADEIRSRFDAVEQELAPFRTADGFVPYTALDTEQTRAIARRVDAVAEPLSRVAEQVV